MKNIYIQSQKIVGQGQFTEFVKVFLDPALLAAQK